MLKIKCKEFGLLLLASVFLFFGTSVLAETFGYDTEKVWWVESINLTTPEKVLGSKFNLSDRAEVQSVSAYLHINANNQFMRAGIYDWTGNLVAQSESITAPQGEEWVIFSFLENPILERADYWLAITGVNQWGVGYDVYIYVIRDGTGGTYQKIYSYSELPLSYADASFLDDRELVIYATYDVLPSILSISGENITTLLANAGTMVDDAKIVMVFAIGLPLGFWTIKKLIALITKR